MSKADRGMMFEKKLLILILVIVVFGVLAISLKNQNMMWQATTAQQGSAIQQGSDLDQASDELDAVNVDGVDSGLNQLGTQTF